LVLSMSFHFKYLHSFSVCFMSATWSYRVFMRCVSIL